MITLDCDEMDIVVKDKPLLRCTGFYDVEDGQGVGLVAVVADFDHELADDGFCPITVDLYAHGEYDESTADDAVATLVEPSCFAEGPELVDAGVRMVTTSLRASANGAPTTWPARTPRRDTNVMIDSVDTYELATARRFNAASSNPAVAARLDAVAEWADRFDPDADTSFLTQDDVPVAVRPELLADLRTVLHEITADLDLIIARAGECHGIPLSRPAVTMGDLVWPYFVVADTAENHGLTVFSPDERENVA